MGSLSEMLVLFNYLFALHPVGAFANCFSSLWDATRVCLFTFWINLKLIHSLLSMTIALTSLRQWLHPIHIVCCFFFFVFVEETLRPVTKWISRANWASRERLFALLVAQVVFWSLLIWTIWYLVEDGAFWVFGAHDLKIHFFQNFISIWRPSRLSSMTSPHRRLKLISVENSLTAGSFHPKKLSHKINKPSRVHRLHCVPFKARPFTEATAA